MVEVRWSAATPDGDQRAGRNLTTENGWEDNGWLLLQLAGTREVGEGWDEQEGGGWTEESAERD